MWILKWSLNSIIVFARVFDKDSSIDTRVSKGNLFEESDDREYVGEASDRRLQAIRRQSQEATRMCGVVSSDGLTGSLKAFESLQIQTIFNKQNDKQFLRFLCIMIPVRYGQFVYGAKHSSD